jgi:hypothetical protein
MILAVTAGSGAATAGMAMASAAMAQNVKRMNNFPRNIRAKLRQRAVSRQ